MRLSIRKAMAAIAAIALFLAFVVMRLSVQWGSVKGIWWGWNQVLIGLYVLRPSRLEFVIWSDVSRGHVLFGASPNWDGLIVTWWHENIVVVPYAGIIATLIVLGIGRFLYRRWKRRGPVQLIA